MENNTDTLTNNNNNNTFKENSASSSAIDFNSMMSKMQKVFEFYCQYGERLNSNIMKSNKFMKIAKEAGIIDHIITKTRLELIFKSINKFNTMTFNQFLNSLMKIAEYKYSSNNTNTSTNTNTTASLKENVIRLINEHFLPLYEALFNQGQSQNQSQGQGNSNTYDSNINNSMIIQIENIDTFLYSDITEEILTSVAPVLFDIYRVYFSHEISLTENINYVKDNSLKQYFNFLRQFDISPGLVSKPAAYQVFQSETMSDKVDYSITQNKNFYFRLSKKIDLASVSKYDPNNHNILGQYFIFFKFIRALVKLAEVTFSKLDLGNIAPFEKLIMFFQKVEASEGFLNFELKTYKTHNDKNSLLIKPELIEQLNWPNELKKHQEQLGGGKDKKDEQEGGLGGVSFTNSESNKNLLLIDNYETNIEFSNYLNEVYGNELLQIFKGLCNCGDQFNYKYMKSKAFLKFLVQANLVKVNNKNSFGLKMNEVDTLFMKLSNLNRNMKHEQEVIEENTSSANLIKANSSSINMSKSTPNYNSQHQAKIEFECFLIGIEIISKVVYHQMQPKEAIDKVVQEHIYANLFGNINIKVNSIEDKIEGLKELQGNEEFIKLLEITHKTLTPIFKYYTKANNSLMSFVSFMKFAQDFEIFPRIISKAKLCAFFRGISQYSSVENIENENMLIEQSLFIDILALCALEIIYPQPEPSPIEKMLVLIEKISHSNGPEIIVKQTGSNRLTTQDSLNILEEFKYMYPNYFQTKEEKKETFIDLLSPTEEEQ